MKKLDVTSLLIILILVAGLSLLLYPSVADWWNSFHQSQAISDYADALKELPPEDYDKLFEDAYAYNQALRELQYPLMDYEKVPGYYEQLKVTDSGVICYVNIPKINVKLPVYHGTSEGVLQVAVGHLEGTSLPTGGESTHCVLSAHRGLPSAKLFTDLDQMEVGDRFTLTVADRTMTYEVDQILVVLPEQVNDLYVQEGMDLCTLITCTPYGINSHRMLVRGARVDGDAMSGDYRVTADGVQLDTMAGSVVLMIPFVLLGVVVMVAMEAVARRRNK